ncbi:MAG: molybdate ABC transporter substrate-binding protein [Gammaproteobacteria bacterium]|nr:MAG: molybdate ABC transporter substrate-binding protein [Gammaproteobacteria bacterium]
MTVRIIFSIACLLFLFTTSPVSATLHIAVASNFNSTLKLLLGSYTTKYSTKHDINIIVSSASTGKLTTQIRYGAPYDIFLAADEQNPKLLIAEDLAFKQSAYVYAKGQLAFITKITSATSALDALGSGHIKLLAIANYKTAPYGKVAKSWLEDSGYSDSVLLITSENISQTWQHFQQSGVEAGLVALPQILLSNTNQSYWLLPETVNRRLTQVAVIIKSTKNRLIAEHFMTFLKSKQAKEIIVKAGYKLDP